MKVTLCLRTQPQCASPEPVLQRRAERSVSGPSSAEAHCRLAGPTEDVQDSKKQEENETG